ncbi:hypothetical protein [Maricaulis sp.]|uniref:hypothetical protein n=1 Tax=Maricaulis sp. TaxID=1486257 RepID=UPI003A8E31D8
MDSIADLERALAHELDTGERILWSGKPDAWKLGWDRGGWAFLVSAAILSLLLGVMVLGTRLPAIWLGDARIVFIVLVAVAAFVTSRSAMKILDGHHVRYVLTDRRLIVLEPEAVTVSFAPKALSELICVGDDSRGSLLITKGYWSNLGNGARWVPATGLIGIEKPREVHRLIRKHLLGASTDDR